MANRLSTLLVAVLAVGTLHWAACGGGGTPSDDPGPRDTGMDVADTGDIPVVVPDDGRQDVPLTDGPLDIQYDAPDAGDIVETDVPLPCPGNFLCECEFNSDCYANLCVPTNDKSVCSKLCGIDATCPDGWICDRVSVGGESVYGCIYPFPTLCQPCRSDNECVPQWGAGSRRFVCIDRGPDGSFCGAQCDESGDCPDGYACNEVQAGTGTVKQCEPEDGVCECTDKFVDNGYLTACSITNEFGACRGTRTCDQACDAATPAAETCN
ncbi:MAG TPA: hypothetical protein PK313_11380, partial [Myxococcota bacterium]|nr:hypothetical protein [Myxococcota bacterium]